MPIAKDPSLDPVKGLNTRCELGPVDSNERYRRGARRHRGTLLESVWRKMLELGSFTAPQLSRLLPVSRDYINIYIRALRDGGYLVGGNSRSTWSYHNPHSPTRYTIGPYRDERAPQLAGSGKKGLALGWKTFTPKGT